MAFPRPARSNDASRRAALRTLGRGLVELVLLTADTPRDADPISEGNDG